MSIVTFGWPLVVLLLALAVAAAGCHQTGRVGTPARGTDRRGPGGRPVGRSQPGHRGRAAITAADRPVPDADGGRRGRDFGAGGSPAPCALACWWTTAPIAAGIVPTMALILLSSAMPIEPIAILPTAGILIGGAMTATSIAGRRVTEELTAQRGSYEAALSIGLSRRDGVTLVGREAAGLALIPGLDQTRTVGLVTLPGAFVGVLLAGASPLQAGAVQLLVLLGAAAGPGAGGEGHDRVGLRRPAADRRRPAGRIGRHAGADLISAAGADCSVRRAGWSSARAGTGSLKKKPWPYRHPRRRS